jgi:hypothetical protein
MQSAEELVRDLCPEYMGDYDASALIRSRDKEIVEMCKKTLIPYLSGTGNLGTCQIALDSVLHDLEK